MGWIGKIIGGTIGLLIGGPLGAAAGAALGHGVDSKVPEACCKDGNLYSSPQNRQLTFFVGTFSMIAKVAQADGPVQRSQLREVDNFITYDLKLDPESAAAAFEIFNTALSTFDPFESYAFQFYQQFRSVPHILELLIDILFRVSAADGRITQKEENLIRQAGVIFNFSKGETDTIKKRYDHAAESVYAVLGCSPEDSTEKIKKMYKKLVLEYHPDTIVSKGLPEDFLQLAEEKFQTIQSAYEKIKIERGF